MSDAVDETLKLWGELEADEASRGLEVTREPDLGFVWAIYRWALAKALASAHNVEGEMPAGDFGRWARQVVDLLGQLCDARGASAEVRGAAGDGGHQPRHPRLQRRHVTGSCRPPSLFASPYGLVASALANPRDHRR